MTLAQVQAVVAGFILVILSLTSVAVTVALLLPNISGRSANVLRNHPWKSFIMGLLGLIPGIISVILFRIPVPLAKLCGIVLGLLVLAVATIGGAGLALRLGEQIGEMSGARTSLGNLVRGGILFSLASLFPLIGWYLIAPISVICALGAGIQSLLPQRQSSSAPASGLPVTQGAI
jgi:hypothetical protein